MAPRLLALALALQLLSAATAQKKRPNFLILFLDDHGWGDTGANVNSVEVCEDHRPDVCSPVVWAAQPPQGGAQPHPATRARPQLWPV